MRKSNLSFIFTTALSHRRRVLAVFIVRLLARLFLQCRAAAGGKAFVGHTLEDNVLYAVLLAEGTLRLSVAILVHHEDVGAQAFQVGSEIEVTTAAVDECIMDVADGLHEEEALGLGVCGLVVLELHDGGVGADADVEVAILRRLAEKLNVAAVKQVITATYKYFLGHRG